MKHKYHCPVCGDKVEVNAGRDVVHYWVSTEDGSIAAQDWLLRCQNIRCRAIVIHVPEEKLLGLEIHDYDKGGYRDLLPQEAADWQLCPVVFL